MVQRWRQNFCSVSDAPQYKRNRRNAGLTAYPPPAHCTHSYSVIQRQRDAWINVLASLAHGRVHILITPLSPLPVGTPAARYELASWSTGAHPGISSSSVDAAITGRQGSGTLVPIPVCNHRKVSEALEYELLLCRLEESV
ncbi:hypothetical protein EYF80_004664 [Liparis tanakae]|uniref:Uncharacterized protein n=1 Tax=Liparis tanakae TaxID=230148 RepID=A0A4Z2J4A2_9TELE|nr:hypothetical protein EYF80_004664 [Liparis tanakae]